MLCQLHLPPPHPTRHKQGLCVNQSALITLLPTPVLSKLHGYRFITRFQILNALLRAPLMFY